MVQTVILRKTEYSVTVKYNTDRYKQISFLNIGIPPPLLTLLSVIYNILKCKSVVNNGLSVINIR